MQRIVIIALLSLINCAAFAQGFPSGSDDVEINLDVLKPMEEGYTPPSMFGAPLTNLDEVKEQDEQPEKPKETVKKVEYFNPPPIPPKRPDTLKASKDYLQKLSRKNAAIKAPEMEAPQKVDATIYDSEMNADVMHMDAKSVLSSIEGDTPEEETHEIDTANYKKTKPKPAEKSVPKELTGDILHSVIFDIGELDIPEKSRDFLSNNIALSMKHNPKVRLEIQSFASPNIEEKNSRRTSLLRAINIRNFLESQGISKDRVTIKALGDKTDSTPPDRADLLFLS